eukprot:365729-Chlamydomonas_euryale.AAC.4
MSAASPVANLRHLRPNRRLRPQRGRKPSRPELANRRLQRPSASERLLACLPPQCEAAAAEPAAAAAAAVLSRPANAFVPTLPRSRRRRCVRAGMSYGQTCCRCAT